MNFVLHLINENKKYLHILNVATAFLVRHPIGCFEEVFKMVIVYAYVAVNIYVSSFYRSSLDTIQTFLNKGIPIFMNDEKWCTLPKT